MWIIDEETTRAYRRCMINQPLTETLIAEMGTAGVDIVALLPGSAGSDVSLLEGLPGLKGLDFDWVSMPAVPVSVLARLEEFGTSSNRGARVDLAGLGRASALEGPPKMFTGSFAMVSGLELLALRGLDERGLQVVEGCAELRILRVTARARKASVGWQNPPRRLRELQLNGVVLETLSGVEDLPDLEFFLINGGSAAREVTLDLSPLARCRRLKVVGIDGYRGVTGLDRLDELTTLSTLHVPT